MAVEQEIPEDKTRYLRTFHGGFYPVGVNNKWHTGIHIEGAGPIRPIAPGRIIASRITENELDTDAIFKLIYDNRYSNLPGVLKEIVDKSRPEIRSAIDRHFSFSQLSFKYQYSSLSPIDNSNSDGELIKHFFCATSNNFILMKHNLTSNDTTIYFYSLYMHLKAYNLLNLAEKRTLPDFYENLISADRKWFFKTVAANSIGEKNVKNEEHDVDADMIIGYSGSIPYQDNTYHLEVFGEESILDMTNLIDSQKTDTDSVGVYKRTSDNKELEYGYKTPGDENAEETYHFAREDGQTADSKYKGSEILRISKYTDKRGSSGDGQEEDGSAAYKIKQYNPLQWAGFTVYPGPSEENGQSRFTTLCHINEIIEELDIDGNNTIEVREIIAAINREGAGNGGIVNKLSKAIIYASSEWDGGTLKKLKEDKDFLWGHTDQFKQNYIKYLSSICFMHEVPALKGKTFYYFYPDAFVENILRLNAGWRLTDKGKLLRGATGYLIDENGYYLLEDGRRLTREIIVRDSLETFRIGKNDVRLGLEDILGRTYTDYIPLEYDAFELFKKYGSLMPDVVYQAFQINRGYELLEDMGTDYKWEQCTRLYLPSSVSDARLNPRLIHVVPAEKCLFTAIGKDETGIPIIATRIGSETAEKKLVIAGPHGDERNAQRLILIAQRNFTKNYLPVNIMNGKLVLYFIPCLSPTMAFADARGIPNKFWEPGTATTPTTLPGVAINGKIERFLLRKGFTIPDLHDALVESVDIGLSTKINMRNAIQYYNGQPTHPKYGVDANRDFYFSLQSSQVFMNLMDYIKKSVNTSDTTKVQTEIYDPALKRKTVAEHETINAIRVFMIHGYDQTGAVYGPYDVIKKNANVPWPAAMSKHDIDMVDKIMELLNMILWPIRPGNYLYDKTAEDAKQYRGEWSRNLYELKIWAADIELPGHNAYRVVSYDEGRRGELYIPKYVGKKELPYFYDDSDFFKFLREYEWP